MSTWLRLHSGVWLCGFYPSLATSCLCGPGQMTHALHVKAQTLYLKHGWDDKTYPVEQL